VALSKRQTRASPRPSVDGRELAARAARTVAELKALDVKVLDVGALTDVMDYMVLATGQSDRHLRALAIALEELLDELGRTLVGREGEDRSGWIVIDAGDVVVHLLNRALRAYYDIDGLWADAAVEPFAEPGQEVAE